MIDVEAYAAICQRDLQIAALEQTNELLRLENARLRDQVVELGQRLHDARVLRASPDRIGRTATELENLEGNQ